MGGVRNGSDPRDSRESGTGSPAARPAASTSHSAASAPDSAASAPPADGKRALRRTLLDARARLTSEETDAAARALTRHALELPELTGASTVAAYVSVGREPGTRTLLDALRTRGVRVLLPVLLPDDDLDWGEYEGADRLVRAGRGLLEPEGPRLGPGAVREAGAVLLPGLAVDGRGMRLGRGGGSYDRVLERLAAVPVPPCLVVLLYAHEVVVHVPEEAHDRPVHAVVTPDGVRRFTRA
ncbi:5-formyltetrahydrofolate cyclo-ligase [Streptomyces tsukubensis]